MWPCRTGNNVESEKPPGLRHRDPVVPLDRPSPGSGERLAVDGPELAGVAAGQLDVLHTAAPGGVVQPVGQEVIDFRGGAVDGDLVFGVGHSVPLVRLPAGGGNYYICISASSKISSLNLPLPSDRNGWPSASAFAPSRFSASTIE